MIDFNADSSPVPGPPGAASGEMDEIYALMMTALDGELNAAEEADLAVQLLAKPKLQREWESWQAVDELFRTTPAVAPVAIDFTAQTLARLPNPSQRFWILGGLYTLLFFLGVMPLVAATWLAGNLAPLNNPPVIVRSIATVVLETFRLIQIVLRGLAVGAAEFIQQQPLVLLLALALLGVVFLWNTVYRQLTRPAVVRERVTI